MDEGSQLHKNPGLIGLKLSQAKFAQASSFEIPTQLENSVDEGSQLHKNPGLIGLKLSQAKFAQASSLKTASHELWMKVVNGIKTQA